MRIQNDTTPGDASEPFAELLRMQTDFQARLADETFRYLRRLHGTLGPGSPGTVVAPREGLQLRGRGAPGGELTIALEIENVQRVHCIVSPQLTPVVGRTGTTWFPATSPPHPTFLVPPGGSERVTLRLVVPPDLPVDSYHGALLLQGFRDGAVAVRLDVATPDDSTDEVIEVTSVETGPRAKSPKPNSPPKSPKPKSPPKRGGKGAGAPARRRGGAR